MNYEHLPNFSIMYLIYSLCTCYVGYFQVNPTTQTHAGRWTGGYKLILGVNDVGVCVCVTAV